MQCLLYIIWAWQNRHYHSEAPLTANSYWILFYSDIGFCVHFPCCLAVMLHCQRIARTEPLLIDVAREELEELTSHWMVVSQIWNGTKKEKFPFQDEKLPKARHENDFNVIVCAPGDIVFAAKYTASCTGTKLGRVFTGRLKFPRWLHPRENI